MIRLFIAFALTVLLFSQFLAAEEMKPAASALEGRWTLVDADDSDGIAKKDGFTKHVLGVEGDQMWEEHAKKNKEVRRSFKLQPTKDPKQIDFRTEGKDPVGQDRFGIFKVDGDKLTICFSTVVPANESQRPTDFTVKPGTGRVILVYERVMK